MLNGSARDFRGEDLLLLHCSLHFRTSCKRFMITLCCQTISKSFSQDLQGSINFQNKSFFKLLLDNGSNVTSHKQNTPLIDMFVCFIILESSFYYSTLFLY